MQKDESTDKIYCANCSKCIVVKVPVPNKPDQYLLRLKCSAGVWQKKLGTEKLHKYFTAARRTVDECENYDEMGDLVTFIKSLRKTLPATDELYKLGEQLQFAKNMDDDNDDETDEEEDNDDEKDE